MEILQFIYKKLLIFDNYYIFVTPPIEWALLGRAVAFAGSMDPAGQRLSCPHFARGKKR